MLTTITTPDIKKRIKEAGADIGSLAYELAYLASFNIPIRLSNTYIFIRNLEFKIPEEVNVATLRHHVITYGCTLVKFNSRAESSSIFYTRAHPYNGKILRHPKKR